MIFLEVDTEYTRPLQLLLWNEEIYVSASTSRWHPLEKLPWMNGQGLHSLCPLISVEQAYFLFLCEELSMAKNRDRELEVITKDDVGEMPAGALKVPSLLFSPVASRENEVASAFGEVRTGTRAEATSLPIIQINHEDGEFMLSGMSMGPHIHGYPVHWFQARAWWPKPPGKGGETNPPTCWSADMARPHLSVVGASRQSESCVGCPKAEWGSSPAGTKGQACRVSTFLFLVNPAFGNPPIAALILPPTSIKPLMGGGRAPGYLQGAKFFRDPNSGLVAHHHELVWTKFGLERAGDKHFELRPAGEAVCPTADEARALAGLANKFMALMESLRGSSITVTALDPNEG